MRLVSFLVQHGHFGDVFLLSMPISDPFRGDPCGLPSKGRHTFRLPAATQTADLCAALLRGEHEGDVQRFTHPLAKQGETGRRCPNNLRRALRLKEGRVSPRNAVEDIKLVLPQEAWRMRGRPLDMIRPPDTCDADAK